MEGDARRAMLLKLLEESEIPLSGTLLAKKAKVSRQVIVQDIALLRANNKNILSTNKGYILYRNNHDKFRKAFKVNHNANEIADELYTIVDNGGHILDVIIEHPIYGQISVDLIINNRYDVDTFVQKINENQTKPLTALTDGIHYHTVECESEACLKQVELALNNKHFLIK